MPFLSASRSPALQCLDIDWTDITDANRRERVSAGKVSSPFEFEFRRAMDTCRRLHCCTCMHSGYNTCAVHPSISRSRARFCFCTCAHRSRVLNLARYVVDDHFHFPHHDFVRITMCQQDKIHWCFKMYSTHMIHVHIRSNLLRDTNNNN